MMGAYAVGVGMICQVRAILTETCLLMACWCLGDWEPAVCPYCRWGVIFFDSAAFLSACSTLDPTFQGR